MRVLFRLVLIAVVFSLPLRAQQSLPPYKDPHLAIEDRVADLLWRMTLEEKVEQLCGGGAARRGLVDTSGKLPYKTAEDAFKELWREDNKIGPRERALIHNALQRYQMGTTRLGIPDIVFGEGLHGYMAYGSTSFPQALGLASTWDPALVKQVFTVVGDEMGSSGGSQAFSPVLDLARDPRWGRTEETYGRIRISVRGWAWRRLKGCKETRS